ncbi:hypothetical protein T4A_9454 [Trichinella pseudospiralis]|uniref:Uncharacterized protein n=1 Tax=Trichinella pseudospiralis TaxID=6337 RepID=A0A0V1EK39_TRIPS|nr:hypothetical protein T4A_9454 [Trichinella pseudospiralis]KRZ42804.1 hypothetical protein T4C_6705 [Trichinella pseudospiralis]
MIRLNTLRTTYSKRKAFVLYISYFFSASSCKLHNKYIMHFSNEHALREHTDSRERDIFYISDGLSDRVYIREALQRQPAGGDEEEEEAKKRRNYKQEQEKAFTFKTSICSIATVKVLQIFLSAVILGCLLSQCKFTNYLTEYCYRRGTQFELQNIPIVVVAFQLIVCCIFLIWWIVVLQTNNAANLPQSSIDGSLRKADGIVSVCFFIATLLAFMIEIGMLIKFNAGFSCATCHIEFLWTCTAVNMPFTLHTDTPVECNRLSKMSFPQTLI